MWKREESEVAKARRVAEAVAKTPRGGVPDDITDADLGLAVRVIRLANWQALTKNQAATISSIPGDEADRLMSGMAQRSHGGPKQEHSVPALVEHRAALREMFAVGLLRQATVVYEAIAKAGRPKQPEQRPGDC